MSDLINRQDAIDEAEEWIETYSSGRGGQRERDVIKHVISGIKKLPSAQQWIPCSERPPEEEGEYLCCDEEGSRWVDSFQDGEWFMEMFSGVEWLAWMPLPEPWEGVEDGKNN